MRGSSELNEHSKKKTIYLDNIKNQSNPILDNFTKFNNCAAI